MVLILAIPLSMEKENMHAFSSDIEILGCNRGVEQDPNGIYGRSSYISGNEIFKRLFIQRKLKS